MPDECEITLFHRGDPLEDGTEDLSDAIFLLTFSFLAGPAPDCMESGDINNDGRIDLTDAIVLLGYLFLAGPAPALPGPHSAGCGPDPDEPGSAGDLGCAYYASCR